MGIALTVLHEAASTGLQQESGN